MNAKQHLRPVAADEVAPPREPLTLTEAVESGVYVEILRAQRREIVSSVGTEKGPALAALHRQLAAISKEIEAIEVRDSEDDDDVRDLPDEEWDEEAL